MNDERKTKAQLIQELSELRQQLAELKDPPEKHYSDIRIQHPDHELDTLVQQLKQANEKLQQEITERKQAETALRESEERFRATFEQAAVGIAHVGLDGQWLRVNQKLCDILGYSRQEMLSKRFQDITYFSDLEIDLELTRQVLAGETQTYSMAKRYLHQDGSLIWVNLTVSLVRSINAEPTYFIAVIEDITRRKQLEERLQELKRIEAISTLAGGIAHDFNNILTVITGNCELILDSPDINDQIRQDVEKINRGGKRAAALTSQLLAFSRQQMLHPKIVNLNMIIADMEQALRQALNETIMLTISLEAMPGRVKIDPDQFEQVILSLVSNAGDAMPDGGKLTIETTNFLLDEASITQQMIVSPGSYVMLAIADTGTGMDNKIQPHIYEPFFTTKEVGKGTGLGLAMVYGIVKQSEGYIQFQSKSKQGSIFKIFLPQIGDV